MKYKNLYINGCSFTKGHHLKKEDTWPVKLSNKLELKLHNHSQNGQSFQSIAYNSFMHLSTFNPKDTFVVIGLTWLPRYMVQLDQITANMTPTNIGFTSTYEDKIHRGGHPNYYIDENYNLDNVRENILDSVNYYDILKKFNDYYLALITNQPSEVLENNQRYNYLYTLVGLQSFLEQRGFDYRFVSFQGSNEYIDDVAPAIINQVNLDKMIQLFEYHTEYIEDKDSHPSAAGCDLITEKILERI